MEQSLPWLPPPIREALQKTGVDGDVFLVGGAVRDAILGVKCRDYDFVLAGRTKQIARRTADFLGGDFYPLDEERQVMRVLWYPNAKEVLTLDFAPFQGGTLEADLANRDFTINAMAVNLADPGRVIDPLGGAIDLKNRRLKRCRENSILDDPVRSVRAARIAIQLTMTIEPETIKEIRKATGRLGSISAERMRDELFRLLAGRRVSSAIRLLENLGLLKELFPEIARLQGVEQHSAHSMDVYDHTLAGVSRLEDLIDLLDQENANEPVPDLTSAQAVSMLGPYRSNYRDHLQERITDERTRRGLLFFAALFHDAGKAISTRRGADGELHSYGHETSGAKIAANRSRSLACSNRESEIIERIVKNHMRPNLLRKSPGGATPKAIYRFFRDCGEEGMDICLLSLADLLAKRAGAPDREDWLGLLELNGSLLDAWFNHREEKIMPPRLVDGNELMAALSIPPGPAVGKALAAITEAQVEGQVHSPQEAIAFIQRHQSKKKKETARDD